jgi:hypothetical protein
LNWREALTAISNGGYRTCHRVKRQQVPTASSNGGSRLLLIKFETTIYFRKIIKKNKKNPVRPTLGLPPRYPSSLSQKKLSIGNTAAQGKKKNKV